MNIKKSASVIATAILTAIVSQAHAAPPVEDRVLRDCTITPSNAQSGLVLAWNATLKEIELQKASSTATHQKWDLTHVTTVSTKTKGDDGERYIISSGYDGACVVFNGKKVEGTLLTTGSCASGNSWELRISPTLTLPLYVIQEYDHVFKTKPLGWDMRGKRNEAGAPVQSWTVTVPGAHQLFNIYGCTDMAGKSQKPAG